MTELVGVGRELKKALVGKYAMSKVRKWDGKDGISRRLRLTLG